MKSLIYLNFLIAFIGGTSLYASPIRFNKGIYGDDNRRFISEATPLEKNLSRSILAQVPFYKILSKDKLTTTFETKTPHEVLNLCAEEKFAFESMLSSCTGFLVAPDILVTAGHCIKDKTDCQKNLWLLDFDQSDSTFSNEQIVYCKEIIDSKALTDYAIIRLDRSLLDRPILKLRQKDSINKNAELTVIGHPLGLPKIATDQAFLHGNLLNKTFTILSDTYSGNSGSPVIDIKTSLVEGILIRGDRDFSLDIDSGCQRSVHCDESSCIGETVLRSIYIPFSYPLPILH